MKHCVAQRCNYFHLGNKARNKIVSCNSQYSFIAVYYKLWYSMLAHVILLIFMPYDIVKTKKQRGI